MNQKCIRCGVTSDDLKCYGCYKKVRNVFVPAKVMDVQRQFIVEQQETLKKTVQEKFKDLVNLNAIERISILQKKYCEVKDELLEQEENVQLFQNLSKEIEETNALKRKRIELLKVYLEKQKKDQKKVNEELENRENILLNLKKRKVEMIYNLRVINHTYPNWSINGELEKIEIPFYNKKSNKQEKSYQNYILFKKKWNFLTQVQQQQFLFSLNQIALFIYGLQSIFKIQSQFPLVRKYREQITISGDNIRIYDENFRIIYDENIIYIYLNYKLILQRFNINTTRNPYFFFDFSYFKERFLARQSRRDKNNYIKSATNIDLNSSFTKAVMSSNIINKQESAKKNNQSQQNVFQSKQDNLFINLENSRHQNIYEQAFPEKQISQKPQQSNLVHSDQNLIQTQEQIRVRSLTHLEELNRIASSPFNQQQIQHTHNFIPEQGKTYRLLFVKSPLIKIEYEDNLKQKEISFNDPYVYASQKVVQGGWEIYDADDY